MCSYAVEPGGEKVQIRIKPLQYTENYLPVCSCELVMPLSQVACMHASNNALNLMPSCTHLLSLAKSVRKYSADIIAASSFFNQCNHNWPPMLSNLVK